MCVEEVKFRMGKRLKNNMPFDKLQQRLENKFKNKKIHMNLHANDELSIKVDSAIFYFDAKDVNSDNMQQVEDFISKRIK